MKTKKQLITEVINTDKISEKDFLLIPFLIQTFITIIENAKIIV